MTPHYIAAVCERVYNRIDLSNLETIYAYNRACTLLEENIQRYFLTFDTTELVYKHAKGLSNRKIEFENFCRRYGRSDRIAAYKEFGGNINRLYKKIVDGKFVIPKI